MSNEDHQAKSKYSKLVVVILALAAVQVWLGVGVMLIAQALYLLPTAGVMQVMGLAIQMYVGAIIASLSGYGLWQAIRFARK